MGVAGRRHEPFGMFDIFLQADPWHVIGVASFCSVGTPSA